MISPFWAIAANSPPLPVLRQGRERGLAFDPVTRRNEMVARVLALRYDSLKAQHTGVMEDIRAVCLQVLIQSQAQRRSREKAAECCLAHDERIAAQIIAVELDQVEGVEENTIIVVRLTDAVARRRSGRRAPSCPRASPR